MSNLNDDMVTVSPGDDRHAEAQLQRIQEKYNDLVSQIKNAYLYYVGKTDDSEN